MSKRAERRAQKDRKKQWARRVWCARFENPTGRDAGYFARTPHPCSCSGCGNPRRNGWDGSPTMQELRHAQSLQGLLP